MIIDDHVPGVYGAAPMGTVQTHTPYVDVSQLLNHMAAVINNVW